MSIYEFKFLRYSVDVIRQHRTMKLIESFHTLGLSQDHLRIFLILTEYGDHTILELSKRTKIPRTTLYTLIEPLEKKGFISRSNELGKTFWSAIQPENVRGIFEKEIFAISQAKNAYEDFLPELLKKRSRRTKTPLLRHFSGVEGIRNVLRDMLNYNNIETQAFWPIRLMVEVLGEEFFIEHNIRRIRQNIWTRALWPEEKALNLKRFQFLGEGKEFRREIRIAPKSIDTPMGYWIYSDKVAFLSSRSELFGFIVQSEELKALLLTQFEFIWLHSKRLQVPKEWTEDFIKLVKS